MPRSNNEIVTEYYKLGQAGQVTFDVFQRFWHEINSNLQAGTLKEWQRQDILSGLATFAEPDWFDLVQTQSQITPRRIA